MKLFEKYEAVKFYEENLIFVTRNKYLYYIYEPGSKYWIKYMNAGNDRISVQNYDELSRDELMSATRGVFPNKETDFLRLCNPERLRAYELLRILDEDYSKYMSDREIYWTVYSFLEESSICHRSYEELRKLFDNAASDAMGKDQLITQIKELSMKIIGRDIYKKEIGIVDGHDCSSYFWIMPVRIIDYSDTGGLDNVAEMRTSEISIEENDVAQYLTPFLYKYFDEELEANKKRLNVVGFEWYLEHNYFTYDSMRNILDDMKDTIDALSTGRENEYILELRVKRGRETNLLLYAKDMTDEQVKEYNASRPTEDDTEADLIIDFYNRFIYRMEYMMRVGEEKGYNLISFMGP